ncbi:MAG: fumarylacetoacetate hydrolase family protein [Bacteroidetes bacterium]|nr:fumarylacetoacetate hydrolase family protein [Bacteroidota bacterium]
MKIICVGRNYSDHVKELNNAIPEEPVIFIKPDSAVLRNNSPFFIPEFSNDVHHEVELVVKICKAGKSIPEAFANDYYQEIGLGIDFTARDLQTNLKQKGLPWEKAKGFDHSAVIGAFYPKSDLPQSVLHFELYKNGVAVQSGKSSDMMNSIPQIIAHVSKFFTLKIGDLIFTGTPSGVGPVKEGDILEGKIEGKTSFKFSVKQ